MLGVGRNEMALGKVCGAIKFQSAVFWNLDQVSFSLWSIGPDAFQLRSEMVFSTQSRHVYEIPIDYSRNGVGRRTGDYQERVRKVA